MRKRKALNDMKFKDEELITEQERLAAERKSRALRDLELATKELQRPSMDTWYSARICSNCIGEALLKFLLFGKQLVPYAEAFARGSNICSFCLVAAKDRESMFINFRDTERLCNVCLEAISSKLSKGALVDERGAERIDEILKD